MLFLRTETKAFTLIAPSTILNPERLQSCLFSMEMLTHSLSMQTSLSRRCPMCCMETFVKLVLFLLELTRELLSILSLCMVKNRTKRQLFIPEKRLLLLIQATLKIAKELQRRIIKWQTILRRQTVKRPLLMYLILSAKSRRLWSMR